MVAATLFCFLEAAGTWRSLGISCGYTAVSVATEVPLHSLRLKTTDSSAQQWQEETRVERESDSDTVTAAADSFFAQAEQALVARPSREADALVAYRAALAANPSHKGALAGLIAVVGAVVGCANSNASVGNATADATSNTHADGAAAAAVLFADAELALWEGNLSKAYAFQCRATRRSSVCLGHSLSSERSSAGYTYGALAAVTVSPQLPVAATAVSTYRVRFCATVSC